ncbi:MAG: metal ABC transporter ATP-binding protein [Planctomycetota bacterium]
MNQPVIQIRDLGIRLGGRAILEKLDLEVGLGEFVVVLGPNGAGKSTLLKLLLGLIHPDRGEIRVLGRAPRRGNTLIGFSPQHRTLETDFALSARDIVGFGLDGHRWGIPLRNRERRRKIDEALEEVNALAFADSPIGNLSGGEQQRLLIAQALITNPQLLLLDEPFSNLDMNSEMEIITQISRLVRQRNITTLLVTHDVNPLLHVTDRVLFLSNGHGAIGTPEEVITGETLSRLYGAPVEVVRASGRVFVLGVEI